MIDDPVDEKMPALIQVSQHAIDRAYAVLNGYRRVDNGHNPNHRILAGWAAVMLDIDAVAAVLSTADDFHEDYYLQKRGDVAVWGEYANGVDYQNTVYWNYIMGYGGSRSQADPYGYIDGGELSEEGAA